MKTYTIGTSWKRLLAVSAVLSAVMTGYSAVILAAPIGCDPNAPHGCGELRQAHDTAADWTIGDNKVIGNSLHTRAQ